MLKKMVKVITGFPLFWTTLYIDDSYKNIVPLVSGSAAVDIVCWGYCRTTYAAYSCGSWQSCRHAKKLHTSRHNGHPSWAVSFRWHSVGTVRRRRCSRDSNDSTAALSTLTADCREMPLDASIQKKKKISHRPRSVAWELIPFEALSAGEG